MGLTPADVFAWMRRFWWLIAAILAVILALWAWEKVKAPFVWLGERFCVEGSECQVRRLEERNAQLESAVRSAVAEANARDRLSAATEAATETRVETRTIVVHGQTEAQGAPDAQNPVGPDRDARARAVRQRLCVAHPAACAGQPAED